MFSAIGSTLLLVIIPAQGQFGQKKFLVECMRMVMATPLADFIN